MIDPTPIRPAYAARGRRRYGAPGACLLALLLASCGDDGASHDGPDDHPDDVSDTAFDASDASGDTALPDVGDPDGGDPDATDATDATPLEFCEGATQLRYDPFASDELLLWPDDVLTVDDDSSPTGRRLRLDEDTTPWLGQIPPLLKPVADDMSVLSGFGTSAAIVLRFTSAVEGLPSTDRESVESDAIGLWDLSTTPPERVPFEIELSDAGRDVLVWPLVPMRRGARHALVVTERLIGSDGDCVSPAAVTRTLLSGGDPSDRARLLSAWWDEALQAVGIAPEEVAGMTVFTVHDDLGPVVGAAERILAADGVEPRWIGEAECDEGAPRRCELRMRAWDFRTGRYIATPEPKTEWELRLSIWLPAGEGPHPFLMYGHGINDSRNSGGSVAGRVAEAGFAVVAVDAMAHGDHPSADPASALPALDFLGISLTTVTVDPLSLRGNFDQTALDRLQILEAIRADADIDGDGVDDLDIGRAGYWGISLGAMLGVSFTALSPDIDASILSVGGGRLLTFATDTAQVAQFMPLIENLVGSNELFRRLIPVAQCIVDPADPVTYAPHVLTGRYRADTVPNVLLPVALHDDTVPPATGRALARALGVPQLGEAFRELEVVGRAEAPLRGNFDGGAVTAAYMQFDRVSEGDSVVAATHSNMPLSREGLLQARRFLDSWLADGDAEIIDPYVELATPALGDP